MIKQSANLVIGGVVMQEMVERIIEMDKAARRLTDEAQALRIGAEKEIEIQKQKMRNNYFERARHRIECLREEENKNAEIEISAFKEKAQTLKDELNKRYNENHEKWVDEIFSQITGR